MTKLKIAVDFDNTLDHNSVQSFIQQLIKNGIDVHIVTARFDNIDKYNEEFKVKYHIRDIERQFYHLYEIADKLNIPKENIHYCNMLPKYIFFIDNKDFLFHLDDDEIEVEDINRHTKTRGIKFDGGTWKHRCNSLINIWKFNNSK